MSIGLFDLDLWFYNGNRFPNLELMKIYNYYYQNDTQIVMMRPSDEKTRFEKIFIFKEHLSDFVPARANYAGDNVILFGNGFYGNCILEEKFFKTPPTFLPYDIYSNRIKVVDTYEKIRRNSVIRLATKDYSGFNEDCRIIYIADDNPHTYSEFFELLEKTKNKKYKFNFFYNLQINNPEQLDSIRNFLPKFKREVIICYKVSNDFIIDAINKNLSNYILYNNNVCSGEDILYNTINLILIYKKFNKVFYLMNSTPILYQALITWSSSKIPVSFFQFYKNNNKILSEADRAPSNIRLLLKQNPLTYNP